MAIEKKYFSISEVTQETGLASSKLRYVEKSNPLVKVVKIRDRRYYTKETIAYIKKLYSKNNYTESLAHKNNYNIISRIDILLEQLYKFVK
jgi:DNA-binding transcriptional MerR regulator